MNTPRWRALLMPGIMFAFFWTLAIVLAVLTHQPFFILNFGYIGTSVAVGMALFALLPREKKVIGRKVTLFLVGGYMLGLLGLLGRENMQLEGFLFYLLAGVSGGALVHYLIAKVFGPLLFGRGWCGWACWTVMVLDLLPFTKSPGRLRGGWGWLRYAHFAVSLGLVAAFWVFWRHQFTQAHTDNLLFIALLAGNALYYAAGIGMAYALQDNRAFCKYLCPITVVLKLGARWSLAKVGGKAEQCTGCAACTRACPMDIRIHDYIQQGRRVVSSECIQCQLCLNSCPTKTLGITMGVDGRGPELLRERE